MAGREDSKRRKRLSVAGVERAERVLHLAWLSLPPAHRVLLESIGASQWQAVDERLGVSVDGFLRSAGHRALSRSAHIGLDNAVAVWIQDLRVVLLNISHPALTGLNQPAYDEFVSCTAWHEWGHALGMTRCSPEAWLPEPDCLTWPQRVYAKASAAAGIVLRNTRTSWSPRPTRC